MSLWSELRRRHVIRVAIIYLVVAFTVAQVADVFLPGLGLPESSVTLVLALLVLGFPVAMVLAWAYDLRPGGVVRTEPLESAGRAESGSSSQQSASSAPPSRGGVAGPGVSQRPGESHAFVNSPVAEAASPTPRPAAVEASRPADPHAGHEHHTLAVLPLANLSADPDNEYFSDGITDDILTAVSFIEGFRVISRQSTMQYKGTTKPIREIGRELGVGAVLEGSVRRAGNRVRIVAQLIDAHTDEHLWADTFDRELEDVFAVQSEVAESIASALKCRITPPGKARLGAQPTENLEAYELVLRGRAEYLQYTEEHVRRGMQYLRQAIELDPDYALAYAHLAAAHFALPYWSPVSSTEIEGPSREAIDRALELDESIPEAHVARGVWKGYFRWDWKGAEADLTYAIELNPSTFDAYVWRALFRSLREQYAAAIEDARRAVALSPLAVHSRQALGQTLYWAGGLDEARELFEDTIRRDPDSLLSHYYMGVMERRAGAVEASMDHYDKALSLDDVPLVWVSKAIGLLTIGREAEADGIMADLEARAQREYVSPFVFALAHRARGDLERSLDYLEAGADTKDVLTLFVRVTAYLGSADSPRYRALLRRIWPDDFPE